MESFCAKAFDNEWTLTIDFPCCAVARSTADVCGRVRWLLHQVLIVPEGGRQPAEKWQWASKLRAVAREGRASGQRQGAPPGCSGGAPQPVPELCRLLTFYC
eukprot:300277-Pleurochrysis_carterae.AAC.1